MGNTNACQMGGDDEPSRKYSNSARAEDRDPKKVKDTVRRELEDLLNSAGGVTMEVLDELLLERPDLLQEFKQHRITGPGNNTIQDTQSDLSVMLDTAADLDKDQEAAPADAAMPVEQASLQDMMALMNADPAQMGAVLQKRKNTVQNGDV